MSNIIVTAFLGTETLMPSEYNLVGNRLMRVRDGALIENFFLINTNVRSVYAQYAHTYTEKIEETYNRSFLSTASRLEEIPEAGRNFLREVVDGGSSTDLFYFGNSCRNILEFFAGVRSFSFLRVVSAVSDSQLMSNVLRIRRSYV